MILGAGRETKEDTIDFSAGINLNIKTGSYIKKGDVLAEIFTSDQEKINQAKDLILSAISFSKTQPIKNKLIYNIETEMR